MNNKVSRFQIGMLLFLLCSSLYLGLSDIILLQKAKNDVLISMIVGLVLGLIPVLMYLKINSVMPSLNIFEKNKKLFGNLPGIILNIIIILIYAFMLILAVKSVVIFVISKYLQNTPFILIGSLVMITILIICFKGIETLARVSQITFFASILFMVFVEILLLKYVKIDNIFPFFTSKNYFGNILNGSLYHTLSFSNLSFLLLTINKSKINDEKKYNKTIIMFYLFSSISIIFVMFFVVGCLGYNSATLFRYPEYILLKKIGISSSDLHLENLLAFRWIFYILALGNISLYGILCGVNNFYKNKKINKIIVTIISIICIFIASKLFGNLPHSIIIMKDYYIPFIGGPIFLVFLVIYIRCLLIKKEAYKK